MAPQTEIPRHPCLLIWGVSPLRSTSSEASGSCAAHLPQERPEHLCVYRPVCAPGLTETSTPRLPSSFTGIAPSRGESRAAAGRGAPGGGAGPAAGGAAPAAGGEALAPESQLRTASSHRYVKQLSPHKKSQEGGTTACVCVCLCAVALHCGRTRVFCTGRTWERVVIGNEVLLDLHG